MGNCVAGGGYLPVLCDALLMTEGSGLYLAGPALVKAAIGQEATSEELGGAQMHAEISGTIDFREQDDAACLERVRRLIQANRAAPAAPSPPFAAVPPERAAAEVFDIFRSEPGQQYDAVELLRCFVDKGTLDEYRAEYGRSLVCAYARIGGFPVGIVANQKKLGVELAQLSWRQQPELPVLYITGNQQRDRLYLNKGGMHFEDITETALGADPGGWRTGVAMADANGDGHLDIYVCRSGPTDDTALTRNLLYLNNGDLTFREAAHDLGVADTSHSTQAAFLDVEGDGDLDLYVINHPKDRLTRVSVSQVRAGIEAGTAPSNRLFVQEDGRFREATREHGLMDFSFSLGVSVAHLDDDDRPDLYVANDFDVADALYTNDGGRFRDVVKERTHHVSNFGMGCDVADINNDALPDIMVLVLESRITSKLYEIYYKETPEERERNYLGDQLVQPRTTKEIRAYVLSDYLLGRHQKLSDYLFKRRQQMYKEVTRISILTGLVTGTTLAAAYLFLAIRGSAGLIDPGGVVLVIGAFTSVSGTLGMISSTFVAVDQHTTFLEDYFSFLSIDKLIKVPESPVRLPAKLLAGIQFDNVTFSYPGDKTQRKFLPRMQTEKQVPPSLK